MSEELRADRESGLSNKKNQYIRKINSLLHISQQNLTLLPKQKKIQKNSSILTMNTKKSKKEKNRESARKARERKKVYVELLQNTIQNLSNLSEEGKKVEIEADLFLKELKHSQKKRESEFEEISMFLDIDDQNERIFEKKVPPSSFQYETRSVSEEKIFQIRSLMFPPVEDNLSILQHEKLHEQLSGISKNIQRYTLNQQRDFDELREIQRGLADLHSDCLISFEQNSSKLRTKEEFIEKMDIEVDVKRESCKIKDFNMSQYQLLQKKMKKFTQLSLNF